MNTTKHTPEPWRIDRNSYDGALRIFQVGGPPIVNSLFQVDAEANARRIVACVNACAGISTDTLEAAPPWKAYHQDDEVRKQRDELATALRAMLAAYAFNATLQKREDLHSAVRESLDALAKVQP